MSVSAAQKLKTPDDENRRRKKLLAESMLDVAVLKNIPRKKLTGHAATRSGVP